jgi:hypothetical protein
MKQIVNVEYSAKKGLTKYSRVSSVPLRIIVMFGIFQDKNGDFAEIYPHR